MDQMESKWRLVLKCLPDVSPISHSISNVSEDISIMSQTFPRFFKIQEVKDFSTGSYCYKIKLNML